jgi:cell division septation protein DedD
MRWFIGALVAVNLAILVWGVLREEPSRNQDLAMPGVGTIRLLHEAGGQLSETTEPAAQPEAAAQDAGGDASVAAARPLPSPAAALPVLDADEAFSRGLLNAPVSPQQADVPLAEESATVEPPAASSPTSAEATAVAKASPPPVEPVIAPTIAAPRFCMRVGPFENAEAAQPLRDYLVERGGEVNSSEQTVQTPVGFWVLVPPQATRAAAREVAAKLKAQGLEYWIIPKGDLRNAISLGLFSGQGNADDFAKEVRAKGFDAEVRERTKDSQQLWLEYQGDVYVPPAQIRSRVPAGANVEEQDCP